MSLAVNQPNHSTFHLATREAGLLYANVNWNMNSAYSIIRSNGHVTQNPGDHCFAALGENEYALYDYDGEEYTGNEELFDEGDWIYYDIQSGKTATIDWAVFYSSMCYGQRDNPDQNTINWIDYVANRSPYSSAFFTKDALNIIKYPYILNTGYPASMVVGAGSLVRHIFEHPRIVKCWNYLVKLGVDEDMAMLMAHASSDRGDDRFDFHTIETFHSPFGYGFCEGLARNLLLHRWNKNLEPFAENTRYSPFNDLWADGVQWDMYAMDSLYLGKGGENGGGWIKTTLGTTVKLPAFEEKGLLEHVKKLRERILG